MKIIVSAIQKGGQGKTMLATSLVFAAIEAGKSVLAVDLDGQGNFSKNLNPSYDRNTSPTFALFGDTLPTPAPAPFSFPNEKNGSMALLTGDHRLVQVDETAELQAGALKAALDQFKGFDLCVIDPPPTLGKRLRAALIAADFVVMPFVPARESIDGLGDLLDTIHTVKHEFNPGLHSIGLLPNKINSRSRAEQEIIAEIEKAAPGMMLSCRINERTSITSAMAASRPVWVNAKGESHRLAAKEVRKACDLILTTVFKK